MLKELDEEIKRLERKLEVLKKKREEVEESERRTRLIERIRSVAGSDEKKIREILAKDQPFCLTCGGKVSCWFYGGYGTISEDGKVNLVGYDELDFKCEEGEDHDVVCPSWLDLGLEDFK